MFSPRKEKTPETGLRKRKFDNTTSEIQQTPRASDAMLPMPKQPSNDEERNPASSTSQLQQTQMNPGTSAGSQLKNETVNNDFFGSPHFLTENNSTNNILSVDDTNTSFGSLEQWERLDNER